MPELWDAYDNNFNKMNGITLVRGEPIPDGIYHLVCEIIIKHMDGTYLLMQRDFRKAYGGMWEVSAGGSALMGENPLTGAIRELKEDLCVTDCGKDSVILQEGETIAYKWIDRNTLLKMSEEEMASERAMEPVEIHPIKSVLCEKRKSGKSKIKMPKPLGFDILGLGYSIE